MLKILQKVPEEPDSEVSITSLDTTSIITIQQLKPEFTFFDCQTVWNFSTFQISKLSYDVELRLAKVNENFQVDKALLTIPREIKTDILDSIAQAIFFLFFLSKQSRVRL